MSKFDPGSICVYISVLIYNLSMQICTFIFILHIYRYLFFHFRSISISFFLRHQQNGLTSCDVFFPSMNSPAKHPALDRLLTQISSRSWAVVGPKHMDQLGQKIRVLKTDCKIDLFLDPWLVSVGSLKRGHRIWSTTMSKV